MITLADLLRIAPNAKREWADWCLRADVRNQAIWLAQCLHESRGLTAFSENLNYSAQGMANTWPDRFAVDPKARPLVPNALALAIAGQPEQIANAAYGGRMGNRLPDDGWNNRGMGPIQVTGREPREMAERDTGIPFATTPEIALRPEEGTRLSTWWWHHNGLDDVTDIYTASRMVNCGPHSKVTAIPHGQAERLAWHNKLQAFA